MFSIEPSNQPQHKYAFAKLVIAFLLLLTASLIFAGAVLAKRSVGMRGNYGPSQMTQAASTPTPSGLSGSSPPSTNNITAQSIEVAAGQHYINFDDVLTGTAITNQYAPAVFSTSFGWYLVAHNQFYDGAFSNYGSSQPNILDHAPIVYPHAFAPLYVDFTQPVNDLKFYVLAVDDLGPAIAQINIYQNHGSAPSATRNIPGFGHFFIPVPVDVGGWGYNNVTRIEIVNVTDTQGIGYDDFTFSIASATPTPTPTPSPTPFAPTNLHGEGHLEEITLVWDLEPNITSYNVKRRASFESSWTTIATGVQPTTFTSFGNTELIGRYRDNSATPDINYSYAVTAVNANGESPFSNIFSAMLEPSCGNFQPAQGPVQQTYPDPGNGWSLTANANGADGLVMSDVRLKNRYMAKMISVPYFVLKTNKMGSPQRGELTASSDAPTMRARLLRYSTPYSVLSSDGHVAQQHYVAEYAVDRLTPTSKSCLLITQDYVFNESNQVGDKCEPSASVPCARFYPKVSYKFKGRAGETLESLNVAQRLHYRVDGIPQNSIGVFRDSELLPTFADKANPAVVEGAYNVIKNGRDAGSWDNIHQTQFDKVDEPPADPLHGVFGGCPDCVHTHWRWGGFFAGPPYYYRIAGYELIGNNPSFFVPTNQDVDIGLVRYRIGEEHPTDFRSLTNNESLKNLVISGVGTRSRTQVKPADVLYWYSATSYEPEEDLFFKHGTWFNPEFQRDVNVPNAAAQTSPAQATEDGVRSITYGHTYKDGTTAFTNIDPNTLAPLPAGYAPLDNRAYKISTDAIVSGPNVVYFDVPSISDQTVFNNLAIFHLETDPFDPDNSVWVDDTILSPDAPAPDFASHVLSGRVNDVGYFAIGLVTQPQPDPGNSDLSIAVNHSASTVTVEDNVSYTLHVSNAGPQLALGVGVVNTLPLETTFMSASSTQGTCKYEEGAIYCKLGTIASGSSVDITIVAKTIEDKAGIQQQGRTITNTSVVAGSNTDTDLGNNSATDNITLVPNPNPRPNVTITSPVSGTSYPGPATTVNIAATTSGNISRVDFYDGSALIGTASGGGNQYQLSWNTSSGAHTIVALATGTNGRINTSDPVNVFVNGAATISITSPASNSIFDSNANLAMTANTSGLVSKVEFFANWISLGQASGGNPYSLTSNLQNGNYALTAVATDASGAITVSAPVNIYVTSRPSVTIASPVDGMTYSVTSRVAIMAAAKDTEGFISKVDFYANGSFLGTGSFMGQDRFGFDWTDTRPGIYSITALATNNLGVTTTSPPISIGIDSQSPQAGEFIWFDDTLPTGAVTHTDDEGWYWVDANPGAFSGSKSHQSRNFGQSNIGSGIHKHYFEGATVTLPLNLGDKLFSYVFLDINNMPREIMLEWKDASGWEHRAYWGANTINAGTDGTNSRRYMGAIPKPGQWVKLEVPASIVGLEGAALNGMAFTLDAGRATWDLTGKATANAPSPPITPSGDSVWIEDLLPTGAVTSTVNDQWNWITNPFTGQLAHQSQTSISHNSLVYRSHSFTGAQTPMQVNPGDVLFTWVLLDPSAKPDQLMLQWFDGSSWNHRAFWGENFIGRQFGNLGIQGTESQRYMGGVPAAGNWYRLEVPAGFVGLEGKSVSGMAFSIYGKEPTVTWDRSGKAPQVFQGMFPLPLSSTSAVWRTVSNSYGYAFETNDLGPEDHGQAKVAFYAHSSQAAGTVPFYRFRQPNIPEYFYAKCRSCYEGNPWVLDVKGDVNSNDGGIAFYVYEDGSTPGTMPLYLYHDNKFHYFLTTNQSEAAGMSLEGIAAYTYPNKPDVLLRPYLLPPGGACANLIWSNTPNATGYKIERRFDSESAWTQIATVGPEVNNYFASCVAGGGSQSSANSDQQNAASSGWSVSFRIRATGSTGDSDYSNEVSYHSCPHGSVCPEGTEPSSVPPNNAPQISVMTPAEGASVGRNFTITANAFDVDGNGTIARVEFFANGNKVGEADDAPYVLSWNNAPFGSYTLAATATDNAGSTTSSIPVSVTVGVSNQTIAFDPIPAKAYGDAPFTVNATSSSGLPVTLSIISGPATISGNTVAITGAGSVTVRASQGGDANYNAAPDVDLSFNVVKASATIALSSLSQTYDGTAKLVTGTTSPVGLSGLSITYNGSGSAPTNVGSYSVVASLANDNYIASDASGTLTIGKASQTITFDQPANKTYGDDSFGLNATSSSNLPVSFSIVSGPATILGSTASLGGAGTVTVRASQSGNANYNSASDVDRSFSVAKASATITLTNLNQNYDGTPKAVTATTNPSGLSGVSVKYNGSSTTPSNAGSYSVVASLINDNYAATDATGTLIINALPTVSISSPTNGALLHATSVTISASAADSDGTVSKVEFFQGSVKLGQVLSAPFSFVWNNVAGGSYSLIAVATDNSGASTVSSPVSITVNNPPNVIVTASSPQDIPTAPAQFSINAEASDADGTISKIDFYQGTTLLATDSTSPYSYTWSNVAAGNYSITAKATDNLGGVTTSNVVGVSVNAKPNVSLASPANGASFFAPALVSLTATASDSDGSISKVEFYQGSTLISTVTASPYSFNWSYVPAGTYALTAKATDNNGASTTSNSVSIIVTTSSVAIGKIAFASNRDGCDQIYLMNTDGTGQTCLSNGASNDESPKWSPDNSRIAFQSDRDFENDGDNPIYGMDIYVMNWDGSGVSRLTNSTYDDINPVWSPDGTKIAFMSFRNGLNYQIYVMNADGSGQVNISNDNANDTQPSWSPDGTKIAFASDRDQAGFLSIYVMNVNGSNQTTVTLSGTGLLDEQPAWSPDGTRLAFISTRDSTVVTWDEWLQGQLVVKTKLLINKEVYVMNADGSSQIRLTNIMGNDDSPVWSPDGTKIAFRSDRDRNCCDPSEQIWMMNADGSNQVNLSNNQFGDHCPSWSR